MSVSRETYAQLNGMGVSADRANTPTLLVAVGGVMVVIALVVLLVGGLRYQAGVTSYERELGAAINLKNQVVEYRGLVDSQPQVSIQYPFEPFFETNIRTLVDETLGPQTATVSRKSSRTLQIDDRLQRSDVAVTITKDTEIEQIMRLIEQLETDLRTRRGFVSEIEIRPNRTGWNGTFQYTIYEVRQ